MDDPTGLIEKKLPLSLTGLEVVYLTDAVGNGDIAQGLPDRDAFVALGRELVLLLAGCYNECIQPLPALPLVGPYTIMVTEEQVWLMRSKVRTADLGLVGQNIGVELSKKLYELLLRFHSGVDGAFDLVEEGDQQWPASGPDLLYAGGYV